MNRQTNRFVIFLVAFLAAILLVILIRSLSQPGPEEQGGPVPTQPGGGVPTPADTSIHLALGNPSGATPDTTNPNNYLMRKPEFALSYNNQKGTPNWVSWRLVKDDLGSAPRFPFFPDLDLPRGFKRIVPNDYNGSGFDRGHMCPHSDRASSDQTSRATFVMTNIIPQAPAVNQKAWADLEDYCRHLARKHQTLYIVAGPQGQGGAGTKGEAAVIGRDQVTVPENCWKVVLALDGGPSGDDAARVGPDARLIAVVMPNKESVGHGWAKYRTSARKIEELTGYRFFDRVPATMIDSLKDKVDSEHIPAPRRRTED